jgi:D-alanyl-D-alanine carboxypeptidase/D-alanyl-D-alanine-endopeptidase (penicillin-binding protein 4)
MPGVRSIAALLLAIALGFCSGCGRRPVEAKSPPTPLPPLLVAAPHAPAWTDRDIARLREKLAEPLSRSVLATTGMAILDSQGRPLFVRREKRPAIPASTFKLLVAVTALQTLGPDFRFETRFEAKDVPHNGTLDGDLYLIGDGDPSLTSDVLRGGIGTIARLGTTDITGAVVADASQFGGREINPAWDPDDLQYDYAAGTSALSLDEGTVELHLVPASVGAPARIDVRPPSDAVRVRGGVLTGYTTSLSITRAADRNDFTFDGHIASDAEQSFYRPVIDQPLYVAGVATSMLRARNITVEAPPRTGVALAGGTVLWRHSSAPLKTLLAHMLFESDNHYAEQLLRAVGAHSGAVGTEKSGAIAERAIFSRLGAPADNLRIVDGSGLAPSDRISPLSMATLLARANLDPTGDVLFHDLARVGIEGTVRHHDVTTALGKARAKSGHIADVNALAGYVDTRRHGRVAFAILVNSPYADAGPVYDGVDAALDILAGS